MIQEDNLELESFSELSIKKKYSVSEMPGDIIFVSGDVCNDMFIDLLKIIFNVYYNNNFNNFFKIFLNENQIIDEESIKSTLLIYYRIINLINNNKGNNYEISMYGNISTIGLIILCSFDKKYIYENYCIKFDINDVPKEYKETFLNILSTRTKLGIEFWKNANGVTFTSSEALEVGIISDKIKTYYKSENIKIDEELTKLYINKKKLKKE